jgi:hypothetical protein
MYSRNYGRGDISAKITPPPAYSGSAIQGKENADMRKDDERASVSAFAPFSQNISLPKNADAEKPEECGACEAPPPCEESRAQAPKKEKGFLSSLLPDLSTEDLILIGIVIALAFDLADRDILLVALVAAAVIM